MTNVRDVIMRNTAIDDSVHLGIMSPFAEFDPDRIERLSVHLAYAITNQ